MNGKYEKMIYAIKIIDFHLNYKEVNKSKIIAEITGRPHIVREPADPASGPTQYSSVWFVINDGTPLHSSSFERVIFFPCDAQKKKTYSTG